MAYAQWVQPSQEHPTSPWPAEYYLSSFIQDTRFLSHIIFPDMPQAHFTFQAPDQSQASCLSPQFVVQSHAQYSSTGGVSRHGTITRRRRTHRDTSRHSTLSRNMITILPPNRSYPYSNYDSPLESVPLALKPRTWRKGYKSPSKRGIGTYLSNFTSLVSRSPPFRSFPTVHPLLSYRSRQPTSFFCDLRTRPGPESGLRIKALDRPANALDFFQLATSPPIQRLLIWHRKLPWKIRVESNSIIGVTIQDVLAGIYDQLRYPIAYDDFYTIGLISEDREQISAVFHERCGGDPQEILSGVRRIDFLGRDFCFVGLSRSRNGTFEMKTVEPTRERMTID